MSGSDTGNLPAFPQVRGENGEWPCDGHGTGGITIRDYFAAAAMAAIIGREKEGAALNESKVAELSYDYADALIAQRSVKGVGE